MTAMQNSHLARAVRVVLVAVSAALLVYVSIGVSLTMTMARQQPDLALRWWTSGGPPRAILANRLVMKEKVESGELAQGARLARSALAREPLNVDAVNALALIAAQNGDVAKASRLYRASEALSRRHLPTQLWLIEESVGRNDIPEALRHYDHALRTSASSAEFLLPTLVAAADDREILPALKTLLAQRPDWWQQFLPLAIKNVRNSQALLEIARALRLNMSVKTESDSIQQIIRRLIADRHYQAAYTYYANIKRLPSTQAAALRDGDFDRDQSSLPFDWWLRDEYELSASKEVFGDDPRLVLRSNAGGGGEVARQLLILSPGRYTLKGMAGATGSGLMEQPMVKIDCVEGAQVIRRALPAADQKGAAFAMGFEIPKTCGGQWLRIVLAPTERSEAWVDSLQITRG